MEGGGGGGGRGVVVAAYDDERRALDVVRCDELEVGKNKRGV